MLVLQQRLLSAQQMDGIVHAHRRHSIPERNAEVEAEDGEPVVLAVARNVNCVHLHGAKVVSDYREWCNEEPAAVIGRAVHPYQGTAQPPVLAELELVPSSRELRQVAPESR